MSRGGDRWISEYNRVCTRADELNQAIQERNRLARAQDGNVSKLTAQVRRQIKELRTATERLEDEVEEAARQYHM